MQSIHIAELKQTFSGEIVLPEDSTYDQVRNSLFAKGRPVIILYPHSAADVAAAIKYIRSNNWVLSIRSGGHSAAGFSTNLDGAIIDMSKLHAIEVIDANRHIVRIGAGARWGEVANSLKEHNLVISSGDTLSVGVGGLTVGGGIGWMVRKCGLTIDSLVGAEIVTADSQILRVSESENPDLFWAIRGGGGNFGIVTSFEFIAQPLGNVYAGIIMYSLTNLKELLKGWRDAMRTADEELTSSLNVMPAFGNNPPGVMISSCYAGDDEAAAIKAIEPLKKLGVIVSEEMKIKPYGEVLEEAHPPEGVKVVVKSCFAQDFSDQMIDAVITAQSQTPNFILQIRSLGGAVRKVAPDATAFAYRNAEALLICPTFIPLDASEDVIKTTLQPWQSIVALGQGAYGGFLSTATEGDIAAVYPKATYERLQGVKKHYDPHNIFHQNFNIKP